MLLSRKKNFRRFPPLGFSPPPSKLIYISTFFPPFFQTKVRGRYFPLLSPSPPSLLFPPSLFPFFPFSLLIMHFAIYTHLGSFIAKCITRREKRAWAKRRSHFSVRPRAYRPEGFHWIYHIHWLSVLGSTPSIGPDGWFRVSPLGSTCLLLSTLPMPCSYPSVYEGMDRRGCCAKCRWSQWSQWSCWS